MAVVDEVGQLPRHNLTIIFSRRDVRGGIVVGPDEFLMISWAKAKILTDQHFRPRLIARSLGREASPINVPELSVAAQRYGCLDLL
jgi:hypothetical protein